jgi:hypothetical protein
VPAAEPAPAKSALRLRCESCLCVIALRHAWDVASCGCGALLLSGRPWRPTIHWLSGPGGGWSQVDDEIPPETGDDQEKEPERGEPERRLGYYSRPRMAVPVDEIQPPVALTQASLASAT